MEVLILALIRFCHFLDFMILMPLGPELTRALSISESQFNLLASAYPLSAGIACFFLAAWIDRFDKKNALLLCFGNFAFATALCGHTENWKVLLALRAYAGLFGGAISSIVYAYLSDRVPAERRGRAMGILTASVTLALVFGAPISLQLSAALGSWQVPFRWLGWASLLTWIFAFIVLKKSSTQIARKTSHLIAPYLSAWNFPKIRTALVLIVLLACGQYSITPNLTLFLKDRGGLSVSAISWVLALGGIFSAICAPLAGKFSDKKGRIPVLRSLLMASIATVVCLALINGIASPLPALIGFAAVAFMGSVTARMVPILTHMTDLAPVEERGAFLLVQNTTQQLASSIATMTAGLCMAANAYSHELGLGYLFVFVFSAVSSIMALWVLR